MKVPAYPEFVSERDDRSLEGPWQVREGSTTRGGASCDLTNRVLEVPLGEGALERLVRAHELMHVRVSPSNVLYRSAHDVSLRSLECAEELRINTLLTRLDFATELLMDGSEKSAGARVAREGNWGEALAFLLAVLNTGAEREYLAGVRRAQPTWIGGLRAVKKRVVRILGELTTAELADTSDDGEGLPRGYAVTVAIARIVDAAAMAMVPVGTEALRQFRRSLEPGGRRAPSGRFAPLRCEAPEGLEHRDRLRTRARYRPSVSGTVMRYPSRLLTDDARRAFASKRPSGGGVIIVDQSGSMDITADDLELLLTRAPNALIIGYSHKPGDSGATSNAWVLATRAGVASSPHKGNIGNGVDGPVLRWALDQRVAREPVIWVTDGQVTDSNDHPCAQLSEECAHLVCAHGIVMVRTLDMANPALACHRPFVSSEFGRVGRKLDEIRASGGY
ncbi:MAG: hypothetical protein HIU84_01680 [Acidobacteria bacterium]|nr:hypothetical protein [Acidobacteriota bacterium]